MRYGLKIVSKQTESFIFKMIKMKNMDYHNPLWDVVCLSSDGEITSSLFEYFILMLY